MRENHLKTLFAEGRAAINGWLSIPSTVSAEALSQVGFDSVTIDLQHGPIDYHGALLMLQAMSASPVVPLCRVPWNDPAHIMKMLDAGSYGIICPMINDRAEAEALVGASRYPPLGYRSHGPTRARLFAGADYPEHANDTVLAFAMIETKAGLDNLEEILGTPGLDGVYVGPADLSLGLGGRPGADWEEGPVPEALERIVTATRARGLVAGLHTASADYAGRMIAKGFQFVSIQSDLSFLTGAAREMIAAVRGDGADTASDGPY